MKYHILKYTANYTAKFLIFSMALFASFGSFLANSAQADFIFRANLNTDQVVGMGTTPDQFGFAEFVLNNDMTQLSYELVLVNMDLAPMGQRMDNNDVDKIHLHNAEPGVQGPHVLNIFGLPSEDDDDLNVNFNAETLSGIWDDGDATGDQQAGGTTKLLSEFTDELFAGELYIAVHTLGVGGDVAIRGQLVAVPEPASGGLLTLLALGAVALNSRRRRK